MQNAYKLIDTFLVRRMQVLTTKLWVYNVWEKGRPAYTHGTVTTFTIDNHNIWYGRLGTRELSESIAKLPYGLERRKEVDTWHNAQYNIAYDLINKAFPETIHNGTKSMGEIELYI